jgi:hypothetical protein
MVWTIDQEPRDGIMFRGQSTVRVRNRKGEVGMASVEYYPTCRVVGPVTELVEGDPSGYPVREAGVIDRRPTFRG